MAITKGFIKDWGGNKILPITRGELVLDQDGKMALSSKYFEAGYNGNEYGLISAADLAKISGGSSGEGISDIYAKLNQINSGLMVNNTALNFYTAAGVATPIKIGSVGDGKITITLGAGNTVNLSLEELQSDVTAITQIIKSITVDKYGRVTSVTGGALTNAEIPAELTGKTITNGTIKNGVTDVKDVANNELAIVNKAYVDSKFNQVNVMATGALKFAGPLNDATIANAALTNKDAFYSYYKVTKKFNISKSNLYDTTGVTGDTLEVQIGDSLIVYPENPTDTTAKFVYIPSGDDITTITVTKDNATTPPFNTKLGNVVLKFSDLFSITNPSQGNTAYISIPAASGSTNGYLTKEDYTAFKNYANNLKVEYAASFTTGKGIYTIGTLTIGTATHTIYGLNNISTLSLENGTGTNTALNPIIKFTETGVTNDVKITVKGTNGIVTKKNGSAIEIGAVNEVATDSTKYLEIDSGYKFKVRIGSVSNNQVVNGLTDYEEFATFRSNVIQTTTQFEIIENSLKDTSFDYYYGSTDLKTAVTLTI